MNGSALTLGLVGALAAASAMSRRGSRDMVTSDTLPSDLVVSVKHRLNVDFDIDYGEVNEILINISKNVCRNWIHRSVRGGTICLLRFSRWGLWEVDYIEAAKGYGPLLYDLAMELAFLEGASGVLPDRSAVSDSAEQVWLRYAESRRDVFSDRLPNDYPDRDKYTLRHRSHLDRVYSKRGTPMLDLLRLRGMLQGCGAPTSLIRLVAGVQA